MKFAYAIALSLALVAPALASPNKTVGQITFSCEITGSGSDGFSVYATNAGPEKQCSATCTIAMGDKKTKTFKFPASGGTQTVRAGRQSFGSGPLTGPGQAPVPPGPLSNPDLSDASCN